MKRISALLLCISFAIALVSCGEKNWDSIFTISKGEEYKDVYDWENACCEYLVTNNTNKSYDISLIFKDSLVNDYKEHEWEAVVDGGTIGPHETISAIVLYGELVENEGYEWNTTRYTTSTPIFERIDFEEL